MAGITPTTKRSLLPVLQHTDGVQVLRVSSVVKSSYNITMSIIYYLGVSVFVFFFPQNELVTNFKAFLLVYPGPTGPDGRAVG